MGPVPPTSSGEVRAHAGRTRPLFAVMATARAMRYLSPEPVPEELLRALVQAAMWAPSGHNAQGEHFVIVIDRATIARLATLWREVVEDCRLADAAMGMERSDPVSLRISAAINYQRDHFEDIPALIVACYDLRELKAKQRDPRVAWKVLRTAGLVRTRRMARRTFRERMEAASIYPAVENLLLAARAHGLGACLTMWHLLREEEVKQILGIPNGIDTFAIIPIGWPLRPFGRVNRQPG